MSTASWAKDAVKDLLKGPFAVVVSSCCAKLGKKPLPWVNNDWEAARKKDRCAITICQHCAIPEGKGPCLASIGPMLEQYARVGRKKE